MYLPGCPSPTDSEVKRNFSWERVSMKAEPLEFPFWAGILKIQGLIEYEDLS